MRSSLDIDTLLQPLSDESPAGADLAYEPEFGELERLLAGTPERSMGDQVIAGEDPDWPASLSKALELSQRTRDLRIAAQLLHAATRIEGLPALADGLRLIHGLLAQHWDAVHPLPDADDNNDPTERLNSLLALTDSDRVLGAVKAAPMVEVPVLGSFSYRDYLVASGDLNPAADESAPPEMPHIEAAFREVDLELLTATADLVQVSRDELSAIDALVTDQVGAAYAADLGSLQDLLKNIGRIFQEQLAARGVGDAPDADSQPAGTSENAAAVSGEIRSREDAIHVLDRVCDYFVQNEPSSPVPLLLRRAQRLVNKDFMEILRDLTPGGVDQAETIGGVEGGED